MTTTTTVRLQTSHSDEAERWLTTLAPAVVRAMVALLTDEDGRPLVGDYVGPVARRSVVALAEINSGQRKWGETIYAVPVEAE